MTNTTPPRPAVACVCISVPRPASARPTRCWRRDDAASSEEPTSSSAGRNPRARTHPATPRGLEVVPRRQVSIAAPNSTKWTSTPSSPGDPRSRWSTRWPTRTRPARRRTKRWEDIEAILDAGIDVITTVNVQHLESLNDALHADHRGRATRNHPRRHRPPPTRSNSSTWPPRRCGVASSMATSTPETGSTPALGNYFRPAT